MTVLWGRRANNKPVKEKILEAYETLAEQYNARIDHKPHNAYYDRPNTLNLIGDVKGERILDAACGPGKYAEIFLEQGAYVTGFDLSPKMVALAKARNGAQGEFFEHDLSQPLAMFEDAQFNCIVCALALHYIEDWNPVLNEFNRVLKKGGRLVISVEHPFFEYTYFKSKRYFDVEEVTATWSGFGERVKVHSFRRSLQEVIQPLVTNGFLVDALVEPKPVAEFEKLDPKHFRELNTFPTFMMVRGIKPN